MCSVLPLVLQEGPVQIKPLPGGWGLFLAPVSKYLGLWFAAA